MFFFYLKKSLRHKRIYRKDKHDSLRVVITYNKLRDTNDT